MYLKQWQTKAMQVLRIKPSYLNKVAYRFTDFGLADFNTAGWRGVLQVPVHSLGQLRIASLDFPKERLQGWFLANASLRMAEFLTRPNFGHLEWEFNNESKIYFPSLALLKALPARKYLTKLILQFEKGRSDIS